MRNKVFSYIAVFGLLLAPFAAAQVEPYTYTHDWAAVTATGPVGAATVDQYLDFSTSTHGSSGVYYTVDWSVTGTPTACTFQIEGSSDGVNWYSLASAVGSPLSCTSSNMISIADKPVRKLRVNVLSYTGNGAAVVFHFTGSK